MKKYTEAVNALRRCYSERCQSKKFTIFSGSSGYERKLITFLAKPLDENVTSIGTVDKCHTYKIARVPCRDFVVSSTEGTAPNKKYYAKCKTQCGDTIKLVEVPAPIVPQQCKALEPNAVKITFPMTKAIKCLVPDLPLPGAYLNSYLGTIGTKVRIVSSCPVKFSIPAVMLFDKENCSVCLVIRNVPCCDKLSSEFGHNHMFGSFGCCDDDCAVKCADDKLAVAIVNSGENRIMRLLSSARKLDVMGVHKCVEQKLWSFQVCSTPYETFCVDACGCSVPTKFVLDGLNEDMSSFVVEADSPYSYEFYYEESQDNSCPTTKPPGQA